MFAGVHINTTEDRAVLHTALRDSTATPLLVDGADVKPGITDTLARMGAFAAAVRSGQIAGAHAIIHRRGEYRHRRIRTSVPAMATLALAPYHDGPRLHFVSNVDGAHLTDVLKPLNPATTLFIIASKTFTTIETMTNARSGGEWIAAARGGSRGGQPFCRRLHRFGEGGSLRHFRERAFGFGIGRRALFGLVRRRVAPDDRRPGRRCSPIS